MWRAPDGWIGLVRGLSVLVVYLVLW